MFNHTKYRIIQRNDRYIVQSDTAPDQRWGNNMIFTSMTPTGWFDLASFTTVEEAEQEKYRRKNYLAPGEILISE